MLAESSSLNGDGSTNSRTVQSTALSPLRASPSSPSLSHSFAIALTPPKPFPRRPISSLPTSIPSVLLIKLVLDH